MHTDSVLTQLDWYQSIWQITNKESDKFKITAHGNKFYSEFPRDQFSSPLLFNIFLCDLFSIMDDIGFASYADENTTYTLGNNVEDVIFKLQNSSKILF